MDLFSSVSANAPWLGRQTIAINTAKQQKRTGSILCILSESFDLAGENDMAVPP